MKLILTILSLNLLQIGFAQRLFNHSIKLKPHESWVRLTDDQVTDSLYLSQVNGFQLEYLEFDAHGMTVTELDVLMKSCRSVSDVIDKSSKIKFDIAVVGNEEEIIISLTGFYYSLSLNNDTYRIIYPRTDRYVSHE